MLLNYYLILFMYYVTQIRSYFHNIQQKKSVKYMLSNIFVIIDKL